MCGIAGIYHADREHPVEQDRLQLAAIRMVERGPDDGGFYVQKGIGLAHRRLAIIDLHSGQQPMTDPASGITLVFNGEIYNYRELRQSLAQQGCPFRTESDTEVLLQAFITWGEGCLSRLNGMFAFAAYDPRNHSLFLARDRVGIKPLYYAQDEHSFCFASSIPALAALRPNDLQLDLAAASHYLTTIRTTLGPDTLIRGFKTLLPGTCLQLINGQLQPIRRYWNFPVIAPQDKPECSEPVAAGTIHNLLLQSVQDRLISDVPLGGFLSGGIDSCIIASLASRLTNHHYNAYSVGYEQNGFNEWPYVDAALAAYPMWCRKIILEPDAYPEHWLSLIASKGLPLSTPNEIPIFNLANALREDFTVALSGEGADEIFGGYTIPYMAAFDFDRATAPTLPATTRTALQRLYGPSLFTDHVTQHFLLNSWMPAAVKSSLLNPDCWNAIHQDAPMQEHYRTLYQQAASGSTLDQHLYVHAHVNLEGLLSRVDSSTMAASVEARVPFTDHRLIEYTAHLPDSMKIRWISESAKQAAAQKNTVEIDQANLIHSKYILRQAFQNEIPDSILNRRKMSFPVPFADWIATRFHDFACRHILDSDLYGSLFNPARIDQLLANAATPPNAHYLWPIINLCIWQKTLNIRTKP